MKADTTKNSGGVTPRHCYFWIATLSDGSMIPEYDFDKPWHNRVRDLPVDFVTKFSWYPVTLTMMDRVFDVFDEELQLPGCNSIHSIDVDLVGGERLRVHPVWRNDIVFFGHGSVMTFYALFKILSDGEISGFWVDENGNKIEDIKT